MGIKSLNYPKCEINNPTSPNLWSYLKVNFFICLFLGNLSLFHMDYPGFNGPGKLGPDLLRSLISSIRVSIFFGGRILNFPFSLLDWLKISCRSRFPFEFHISPRRDLSISVFWFPEVMDEQKLEKLKIQLQQLHNEGLEFVQKIPPAQLYAAIGVVIFTIFFFLIGKLPWLS